MNLVDNMKYNEIKTPEQLLEYMNQNIFYGYVSKDNKVYMEMNEEANRVWYDTCIVQDPNLLIKNKYGTCWDQVELERKWFEDNGYKIETIFMIFSMNKPNNYPTHTFLLFEKNNKIFWFEHSFDIVKGIHEFENISEAIKTIKQKQLEYAISIGVAKKEDEKLIECFKYDKPKPNIGVKEYLNHVLSGIKI
jgi:hypothetical protein